MSDLTQDATLSPESHCFSQLVIGQKEKSLVDYSLRLSLSIALILFSAWLEPPGSARAGAGTKFPKAIASQNGLRFLASLAKSAVSRDEPITLKLSLRNNTKKEITVIESNQLLDYKIDVRDQRGMRVLPTPEGKDLLFRSHWGGRRVSVTIAPGESKTDTFQVNKIYAMTDPGSYTMTASRRAQIAVGKWIELRSNEVKVTVVR
jgi:hypothetical protein